MSILVKATIELITIEDLKRFVSLHGPHIISISTKNADGEDVFTIESYNPKAYICPIQTVEKASYETKEN